MAVSLSRKKLSFEEIFDIQKPPPGEVELERTENLDNMLDPGWNSPVERFNLALHNSDNSILSNMVASKTKSNTVEFSLVLALLNNQYSFILSLLDKLLRSVTNGKEKE